MSSGTGTSDCAYAGGFACSNNGEISRCHGDGDILGTNCSGTIFNAAGFISENSGAIANCYSVSSLDSLKATTSLIACGFADANKNGGTITNCYSAGDISFIATPGGYYLYGYGFVYNNNGTIDCGYWYNSMTNGMGTIGSGTSTDVISVTEAVLQNGSAIGTGTYSTYLIVDALNAKTAATPSIWTDLSSVNSGYPVLAYKVTFDSNGGSDVDSLIADYDSTVAEPADPTLSGYKFKGWYADSALTDLWDFDSDTVFESMTLYAKWTAKSSGGSGSSTVKKPVLSDGTASRTGDTAAAVTFTSSASGIYYYEIIPCGYEAPTISATGTGKTLASRTNTLNLTSLTERGPYYIYVVGKNSAGTGSTIRLTIPYYDDGGTTDISAVFSDVTTTHWAYSYMQQMYDDGIIDGYGTQMLPDDVISRGNVIKMIVRALDFEVSDTVTMTFDDVDDIPDALIGYIQTAVDAGIIKGDDNNNVNANDSITRNEAAVFLQRAFDLVNTSDAAETFNDTVPAWASDAVSAAMDAGAINGYPGNYFYGSDTLSNSQIIKMVCILM